MYCLSSEIPSTHNTKLQLFLLNVIKHGHHVLSISGTAYGNETTLQQGSIIHNGTVIAETTVNGTFEFNVELGTERLSLLFKDTVNKVLLDTVYVVDFPKGAEGMYYITVLMLSTAYTVSMNLVWCLARFKTTTLGNKPKSKAINSNYT